MARKLTPPKPRARARSGRPNGPVTARDVALAALARAEQGAYANLVLPGLLARAGLAEGERAAATDLTYGTIRLRGALDHALRPCSTQPLERLEPLVRHGLRLGAYELLFAGTAPHAAVNEVVAAVRRAGSRGQAGYVNAVLRRLAANPPRWPDPAADPYGWATTRGSHPGWIVAEALARLGDPAELIALVEADNRRPRVSLRATPGPNGGSRDELLAELAAAGIAAEPSALSPDCVLLERGDPGALAAVREGRAVVQDPASALVAPALDPRPGELVVDSCAAPGGKAGHLAALGATVLAVELHPGRARLVADAARRLHLQARLHTVVADGRALPLAPGRADAVLIDAPCSNLGSLRRRPEARWRHQPDELEGLAALQLDLIRAAAAAVRPGGSILYSVCTWTARETDAVVDAALAAIPGLEEAPLAGPAGPGTRRQLWPHQHDSDAIFLARLRKIA